MCGIIAVLRSANPQRRDAAPLLERGDDVFTGLLSALDGLIEGPSPERITALEESARDLEPLAAAVRTPAGVRALLVDSARFSALESRAEEARRRCDRLEEGLDAADGLPEFLPHRDLERANAALLLVRDALWILGRDCPRAVAGVRGLLEGAGVDHLAAVSAALSVHQALSALDRMEVRGRDSAGLHLLCGGHGLDLEAPDVSAQIRERTSPLFENGEARLAGGQIAIVAKVAEEIGELGDNVAALRSGLERDPLLARVLRSEDLQLAVLGHTRWASVGLITEPNAHPLNQELAGGESGESSKDAGEDEVPDPYVVAALNGDVDNYAELKAAEGLRFPEEITTDAKVIPVLTARRVAAGAATEQAFLDTVSSFVGSVAIGLQAAADPDRLFLALRGSGQALYAGLAEDAWIAASELYGVVELTDRYVRLDGETPGDPDSPSGSRGQVMVLDRRRAGERSGMRRIAYDGTELPLSEEDVRRAEITTRDVDRGDHPHYLLKEITEAPRSFEKTLRGRIRREGDALRVDIGPSSIPDDLSHRLREGSVSRILVIGQGTAAVAGRGVAAAVSELLASHVREVRALPATELSGFHLRPDMSDTLVLAISQSGTTTDTNRTVDLVRGRGAVVLAIVNRRNSDLCDKADGVLYTSDGRDIEMSVASTKAFYSQIAAGQLLALGLAQRVLGDGIFEEASVQELLSALRALPEAMRGVLELRGEIDGVARRFVPPERYWALVGNGLNRVAAEEIRIKLSELCYKSIACDSTEDKKHIDLSSEPLILVCAAGLRGSIADDVAKEIEIYSAHKATPIVITGDGEQRFRAAAAVLRVPGVHPSLDYVLASLVGHLFGYSAALAIDELARPLREVRSAIEHLASEWIAAGENADILGNLSERARDPIRRFLGELGEGRYDGHLQASTGSRLALLCRFVLGQLPVASLSDAVDVTAGPGGLVEELSSALTVAIDELTRPVDAIKHQAKTVTVGISRSDEALLTVPLVSELLERGAHRRRIAFADLQTLAALDPVVSSVTGHTRYVLEGDPRADDCLIRKVDTSGVAAELVSRTEEQPVLRGTKRRVALERRVLVSRGSADGRLFVLVPEVEGGRAGGLVLLHIELVESAPVRVLRGVLQGYRNRYEQLRDAVMETEESFREELLSRTGVEDLLMASVSELAERWRDGGTPEGAVTANEAPVAEGGGS